MPFTSNDAHPPLRNARSFDLDDSAAKAAAWVWHLHTSKPGITTEGRLISSQISRRRSSGNYDRKASRFQQEASTTTNTLAGGNNTETPMWDCGSNLYDTFELVDFRNRLDRSLMEAVPIRPPQAEHHMKSPLHKPSGILRTLSLPRSILRQQTSKNCAAISSPKPDVFKLSKSYNHGTRARSTSSGEKASRKWSSMGKLMNVIKKVMVLHKQVSFLGWKRSTNVMECSQRPLDPISETNFIGAMEEKVIRGNNSASLGAMNKKIRSKSERMSDGLLEHKNILRARRKLGRDELVFMEGSDLESKERIKGSDEEGGLREVIWVVIGLRVLMIFISTFTITIIIITIITIWITIWALNLQDLALKLCPTFVQNKAGYSNFH